MSSLRSACDLTGIWWYSVQNGLYSYSTISKKKHTEENMFWQWNGISADDAQYFKSPTIFIIFWQICPHSIQMKGPLQLIWGLFYHMSDNLFFSQACRDLLTFEEKHPIIADWSHFATSRDYHADALEYPSIYSNITIVFTYVFDNLCIWDNVSRKANGLVHFWILLVWLTYSPSI